MELLATEFEEGRYHFRQLDRQGDIAIYEQQHKDNPKVLRYEVIRIRVQPERTWPDGHVTLEREAYPGASQWGTLAWTFFDLPSAQAHAATLRQPPEEVA
jgi:hypothetical protein